MRSCLAEDWETIQGGGGNSKREGGEPSSDLVFTFCSSGRTEYQTLEESKRRAKIDRTFSRYCILTTSPLNIFLFCLVLLLYNVFLFWSFPFVVVVVVGVLVKMFHEIPTYFLFYLISVHFFLWHTWDKDWCVLPLFGLVWLCCAERFTVCLGLAVADFSAHVMYALHSEGCVCSNWVFTARNPCASRIISVQWNGSATASSSWTVQGTCNCYCPDDDSDWPVWVP